MVLVQEFGIFVGDPDLPLALGIDQQGVTRRITHHDTILDGKVVLGKALDVPFSDGSFIDQEGGQFKGGRMGHASLLHVSDEEIMLEHASERGVEGTSIRNEGSGEGTVTD